MKRLFATALTSTVALLAVAAGSASAACVAPYCPAPTATAPVVQNVTDTSADLSGTVAANGAASVSWQIQLGTSSGNYTTVVASGTLENGGRVSGTATGLAPNTTYYFRIAATSAGGNSWSQESSFTTNGAPSTNPPNNGNGNGNNGNGNGNGNGGNDAPSGNAKAKPESLSLTVTPKKATELPVRFNAQGTLVVEDGALCAEGGTVALRFKETGRGGFDLDYETDLNEDCTFARNVRIPKRELGTSGEIKVTAKFTGSDAIKKAKADDAVTVSYDLG